jgi:hypothetical protein
MVELSAVFDSACEVFGGTRTALFGHVGVEVSIKIIL